MAGFDPQANRDAATLMEHHIQHLAEQRRRDIVVLLFVHLVLFCINWVCLVKHSVFVWGLVGWLFTVIATVLLFRAAARDVQRIASAKVRVDLSPVTGRELAEINALASACPEFGAWLREAMSKVDGDQLLKSDYRELSPLFDPRKHRMALGTFPGPPRATV